MLELCMVDTVWVWIQVTRGSFPRVMLLQGFRHKATVDISNAAAGVTKRRVSGMQEPVPRLVTHPSSGKQWIDGDRAPCEHEQTPFCQFHAPSLGGDDLRADGSREMRRRDSYVEAAAGGLPESRRARREKFVLDGGGVFSKPRTSVARH